jgi:hypothetical protein
MEELFSELLPVMLVHIGRGFVVFAPALAVVYIFGRMLEIVKSNRVKNIIAIILILAQTYFYSRYETFADFSEEIQYMLLTAGVGILLFVLIGFKLYARADALQDKKFAPDDENEKEKGKGKK